MEYSKESKQRPVINFPASTLSPVYYSLEIYVQTFLQPLQFLQHFCCCSLKIGGINRLISCVGLNFTSKTYLHGSKAAYHVSLSDD